MKQFRRGSIRLLPLELLLSIVIFCLLVNCQLFGQSDAEIESLPQVAPVCLVCSPDNRLLYVACSDRLSGFPGSEKSGSEKLTSEKSGSEKSSAPSGSTGSSGSSGSSERQSFVGNALLTFEWTDPLKYIGKTPLPGRPTGICCDSQGNIYVTTVNSNAVSFLSRFAGSDGTLQYCVEAGHCARAPICVDCPNGKRVLYFARQFRGELVECNPETGVQTRCWPIGREPYCSAASKDGSKLIVGHLMPDAEFAPWYYPGRVTLLDTQTGTVSAAELPDGMSGLSDVAVSPDGRYALAVHTLGQHEHVASSLNLGWIINNVVSLVDLQTGKYAYTLYLDMPQSGLANPNTLKFSADGNWLYVLLGGRHELLRIEWWATFDRLIKDYPLPSSGPRVGAVSPALDFHTFVKLHGQGPQSLLVRQKSASPNDVLPKSAPPSDAPDAGKLTAASSGSLPVAAAPIIPQDELVVGLYFSDALESLDLSSLPSRINNTSNLRIENYIASNYIVQPRWSYYSLQSTLDEAQRVKPPESARAQWLGEKAFADASRAYQGWVSCISCHHDGRTDGLRWDLLNDGVGNPKSAKSMLLSHKTNPSMVRGVRPTAESAVRAGFIHLLECDPIETDCRNIDVYLSGLQPVPSPYLIKNLVKNSDYTDGQTPASCWTLSEKAKKGKRLFIKSGCSGCHSGELYTDQKRHNAGTCSPDDPDGDYDTPTLIEVWRTAPYLHDNSAVRIRDTFVEGHGSAHRLTDQEIEALEEYVLSL